MIIGKKYVQGLIGCGAGILAGSVFMGVRLRGSGGTLGDIDPLHKVHFQRAISRVKKGT